MTQPKLHCRRARRKGVTLAEYVLVAVLVSIMGIAGCTAIAEAMQTQFGNLAGIVSG